MSRYSPNPSANDPSVLEPRVSAAETNVSLQRARYYTGIRNNLPVSALSKYVYDAAFSLRYDESPVVYTDGHGRFSTNWDTYFYQNVSSKKIYMNTETGTSSNDGLTESTPCQNLDKAILLASIGDTIVITNPSGSVITRSGWAANGIITKSLNIVAKNSGVIIAKADTPSWILTSGQTNVYEVTRSLTVRVVDLNNLSSPVEFTKKTSIAEVAATPYSWYTDGTKVYVNCGVNRIPNTKVLPLINAGNAVIQVSGATSNVKLYLENLVVVGGNENLYVVGDSTYNGHELYTRNCTFLYSTALDACLTQNAKRSYHFRSVCAYSVKDGFNYSTTVGGSNIVDFIEVETYGYANGDNNINTANTHNGSTAHAKSRGVRINCIYFQNVGGQLIDVQGVKSVNLGCITFDSRSTDPTYNQGFGNQGAQGVEDVEQWFEGCISFGNVSDAYAPTGSIIHIRKSQYDTMSGAGTWDVDARL